MNRARDIQERISRMNPLLVDGIVAVALAAFAVLQMWMFTQHAPQFGARHVPPAVFEEMRRSISLLGMPLDLNPWGYLLAACAFLPLTFRRVRPVTVAVVVTACALLYLALPGPPVYVMVGPMIALYTVALRSSKRRTLLYGLLFTGVIVGIGALTVSSTRQVADYAVFFTMVAAVTFFGDMTRTRREYVHEVECRAAEAERTREEEAHRRVDEERLRIAREVHDIVAHSLSIVTVQAGAGLAVLDKDPEQSREALQNIGDTGRSALRELRSMLDVLRTGSESEAPLAPVRDLTHLDELAQPVREAGFDVELIVDGELADVPAFAAVTAYRIVQEALTNVVRHSSAERVVIRVSVSDSVLAVEVLDDGTGARDAFDSNGHGITGMRERAVAVGGDLKAAPRPEGGFAVQSTIPLPRRSA